MGVGKYWESAKISFNNNLMYKADFLANSLFIGLIIFIFINLWKVVYSTGSGAIEGFTINMMIWYFLLTESIVTSPGKVIEAFGEEVQSGEIAHQLNKPYNYVFFKYSSNISETILRFFFTFSIGAIIVLTFVGGINVDWKTLPLIVIVVFLALTLHFCIMALLGIFVFWLEDAKALSFLYNKLVFVIGGMILPLEIFPPWLAKISAVLPFSYVAYHPAKLFVMFSWNSFFKVVLTEIMWIIVTIGMIAILYNVFIKKLSINGG
jgi:ABC-2 type transport system permease protein